MNDFYKDDKSCMKNSGVHPKGLEFENERHSSEEIQEKDSKKLDKGNGPYQPNYGNQVPLKI